MLLQSQLDQTKHAIPGRVNNPDRGDTLGVGRNKFNLGAAEVLPTDKVYKINTIFIKKASPVTTAGKQKPTLPGKISS